MGATETAEKCKTFATHHGFQTLVVDVDVTDASSVQDMVDTAVKEFGRIDYNVHCAGVLFIFFCLAGSIV